MVRLGLDVSCGHVHLARELRNTHNAHYGRKNVDLKNETTLGRSNQSVEINDGSVFPNSSQNILESKDPVGRTIHKT